MTEHVLIERHGAILTIRLNRPEKKNALTRTMYLAMADGLRQAARMTPCMSCCWRAAQDFTAGNDIGDFAKAGERDPKDPGAAFDFLEAILAFEKPVVAAVRGNAVGIGTTMLLHCDVVVASETARLMMPFTRLALCPEAGSSLLMPARVGPAVANWWLLASAGFSGADAAAAGLATRAVADDEVEATAAQMAAPWPPCRRLGAGIEAPDPRAADGGGEGGDGGRTRDLRRAAAQPRGAGGLCGVSQKGGVEKGPPADGAEKPQTPGMG
jgi:enoyl-CoA hydratase/carnithine racemase